MQFLKFVFLFNCQVEFSNFYQNYFQKQYLLQVQAIFSTNCFKGLRKGFWIETIIVSCFYFFDSFMQQAMDKMQVEEVLDFLSQKITYEEISAILLAIYPSVREYSVKSTKRFCKKN